MEHLDITIDFETAALCPTAAPLSIAAVPWNRYDRMTPFFDKDGARPFYEHVDLRSCFVDGFTIDPDTQAWWNRQSKEAKNELIAQPEDNMPLLSLHDVISNLFQWIEDVKQCVGAVSVCLWSQGSDFDIAILRNICSRYPDLTIPVSYKNFRDHRSVCMELGDFLLSVGQKDYKVCLPARNPNFVYEMTQKMDDVITHTPVGDCKRSIYTTWQILNKLQA